ncbi:MAG: DEAD/DEAH box helicase, partial [Silvanigrellaceae bacterium]|nr:DEAD/DEAH box helicase [Silvanigrellaceae bacterium]
MLKEGDGLDFLEKCEEIVVKKFQYPQLRESQRDVLSALEKGHFILAMLPTGAGKTLLYAIPALIFSQGPVIVVSPLISLMRDQATRMEHYGVSCAIFTSEQSEEERQNAWQKLRS